MRALAILRPEPGASRTAARAEAMGLETGLLPLFAVVPLQWTAPDPAAFDAIVLTSANAIRHGGAELEKLLALPVHAVGDATAAAARDAGFEIASAGHGGSGDMRLPPGLRLLHLSGRDHIAVAGALAVPVYDVRPIDDPPDIDRLGGAVVLVHSPRAGGRLAELVADRAGIAIAAISAAAADACGHGWQAVHASPQPNEDALLALAASLCERLDP